MYVDGGKLLALQNSVAALLIDARDTFNRAAISLMLLPMQYG